MHNNFEHSTCTIEKKIIIFLAERIFCIRNGIKNKIQKHCSTDLWSLVLSSNSAININEKHNTWEISEFLDQGPSLLEMLKVVCCFEGLGGSIIYKGEYSPFPVLGDLMNLDKTTTLQLFKIKQFWINNCINGVVPIYDIGEIQVPNILPTFATEECTEGGFVVVKLRYGKYIQLKGEIYPTEESARQRAETLNHEANEDDGIFSKILSR